MDLFKFFLASTPLEPQVPTWESALIGGSPESGAGVSFFGYVRNHHGGRGVKALEYSSYESMALVVGAQLLEEASHRFGLSWAQVGHRIGALTIGEMAVWVSVGHDHRGNAFDACRWLMDAIKAQVPIWKKEWYSDGSVQWVGCDCGG